MASPNQKYPDKGLNLIFFSIPQEALLQVGTVTVLAALVGGKAFFETLEAIAQVSEEVFRGDRLPVLNPVEAESTQS